MTLSSPYINYATANYDGNTTQVLILFTNGGGYGYVQLDVTAGGSVKSSRNGCYDTKVAPLSYKPSILLNGLVQPIDYIKAYRCSADNKQNCSIPSCSEILLSHNYIADIYPILFTSIAPSAPSGLTITPGDGKLDISWNIVSDPSGLSEVFAYYLVIIDSGNPVTSGHMAVRNATIGNLTNGKTYNVELYAVSHSNISSSPSTGSGTPIASCTPPTCSMTVN